jgi:hypothetical protein
MATGSAIVSNLAQRVGPVLVRARRAFAKTQLDQQSHAQNRERHGDQKRGMLGSSSVPAQPSTVIRSSSAFAPKKDNKQPERRVAVVAAFHGDGEFRIGEGQIDDGGKPIAPITAPTKFPINSATTSTPIAIQNCLAADTAIEAVEERNPIIGWLDFNAWP